MSEETDRIEKYRAFLENALDRLIAGIGDVAIGTPKQFPFGWRKAAKGRTVWRIVEELVSQNAENNHRLFGFDSFQPADSEVGVYDFRFAVDGSEMIYVNVKAAVKGERANKDDISKADQLQTFFSEDSERLLFIATIVIEFDPTMMLKLRRAIVMPVMWLPDIYVNPSNNGNVQSSKYKDLQSATRRTGAEFVELLREARELAIGKREAKRLKLTLSWGPPAP